LILPNLDLDGRRLEYEYICAGEEGAPTLIFGRPETILEKR
jgi:hypothetical protein